MTLYSNSYRTTEPFASIYEQYTDELRAIDRDLKMQIKAAHDEYADLNRKYEKAKKEPDFEEGQYFQWEYEYPLIELQKDTNTSLSALLSRLYNVTDKTFKKILKIVPSKPVNYKMVDKDGKQLSKIESQMKHIHEKMGIDVSEFESLTDEINAIKDFRNIETHEGVDFLFESNELAKKIKIHKDDLMSFLSYVLEQMYDKKKSE